MLARSRIIRINPQVNWQSPQAQGLVAAWPLNDGGGTVARSCCGRLDGTLINSPSWGVSSRGRHASFTAANSQYISCPPATNALINGAARLTVSAVLRRKTAGDTNGVTCRVLGGTNGLFLGFYTDKLYANLRNGAASGSYITLNNTNYTNVIMVFNGAGSTNADKLKMYVNGAPQILTFTLTIPTTIATTGQLAIGGDPTGSVYDNGEISDVRVYNRALSASEVQQIYLRPWELYATPRRLLYAASIDEAYNIWLMGQRAQQVWAAGQRAQQIWTGGHRIL